MVGSNVTKLAKIQIDLVQDGLTVSRGLSDVEGDFIIDGVKPGVYSLVATGENELAVYSLSILDATQGSSLPDRLHIRTISSASRRVTELLRGNTMPTWIAGSKKAGAPTVAVTSSHGSPNVLIDSRGGIHGTISKPNANVSTEGTLVCLVQDGKEVARTRTARDGSYRFESVAPGAYGLVVSGPQGIAALGFTAVRASTLASLRANGSKFVSRTATQQDEIPEPQPTQESLDVELAEPDSYVPMETVPLEESVVIGEYPYAPTMGGGAGGFGGGGGGIGAGGGLGAGGLGGIGTLAALGAVTAVAITQASDDGDQAPIVSPIK
jgi:hypothetical protein